MRRLDSIISIRREKGKRYVNLIISLIRQQKGRMYDYWRELKLSVKSDFYRRLKKYERFWTKEFNKGNAQDFRGWLQHNTISRKETSNLLKELNTKTVLDVGCGLVLDYEQYLEDGLQIDYHGIDVTEPFIKEVRKKYPYLDVRLGNAERIPYSDNYFDAVTCRHLLEHLAGLEKVTSEITRVTKRYIIIVWFIPPGNHENKTKVIKWGGGKVTYENSYSVDYVTEILRQNNLAILHKKVAGTDEVWLLKKESR